MAEKLTATDTTKKIVLTLLVWLALFVYAGHSFSHTVSAGDTWVALACGRHFVNHGVTTTDPFSANSHEAGPTAEQLEKYPTFARNFIKKYMPDGWIDQNWLTQYIFYKIIGGTKGAQTDYEALNYDALVVWKLIICLMVISVTYYSSRLLGASQMNAAFWAAAAMAVGRSFIDIRPAVYSNLLVPLFVLILLLAQRKNYLFIWLTVPIVVFWSNVHGGYLYAFIVLVPFWLTAVIAAKWKPASFVEADSKLVLHTALSGAAAFVAMVIFNPYHLTNLTHTFIVTVSEHAARWKDVNEWHGAFEMNNPVGTSYPFLYLFCAGAILFTIWAIVRLSQAASKSGNGYRFDVAHLIIVLFTVNMAIGSRRFIPIAATAMCPLLAMISQEAINRFKVWMSVKPKQLEQIKIVVTAMFALAVFLPGIYWAGKFYKVYRAPFFASADYNSVFMRMTVSHAKPFEACQFIRENQLSGNMLNFWTEGGFIAFTQDCDEKTGAIPLKLYMDGRAQAAYDIEMFDSYTNDVMSGGKSYMQILANARAQRKQVTDYPVQLKAAAQEMSEYLSSKGIWIFLMPANANTTNFMTLMKYSSWRPVYNDSYQQIYVDPATEDGKRLFNGVFNGTTKYPHDYLRDTMELSYRLSGDPASAYEKSLELFSRSRELCVLSMVLESGQRSDEAALYDFCTAQVGRFIRLKDEIVQEDGFITEYYIASSCLRFINSRSKELEQDKPKIKAYETYARALDIEIQDIIKGSGW
ncbi:MAG: hypothetical protein AB7F23_02090 [Phycisphaerae bacterium]